MDNPFELILQKLEEIQQMLSEKNVAKADPIEIIDRKELMKRLNITEPTVIRWAKKGTIPEIHIGSNVRYNWPTVVKELEKVSLNQQARIANRNYRKNEVNALSDNYIKNKITQHYEIGREDIPQSIIDTKRNSIAIKRLIKSKKYK